MTKKLLRGLFLNEANYTATKFRFSCNYLASCPDILSNSFPSPPLGGGTCEEPKEHLHWRLAITFSEDKEHGTVCSSNNIIPLYCRHYYILNHLKQLLSHLHLANFKLWQQCPPSHPRINNSATLDYM